MNHGGFWRPADRGFRWLVLVAVVTMLVPAPVAAQTAPPPSISLSPDYGRAGSSGTWTIEVSGSGAWYNCPSFYGTISFAGEPVAKFAGSNSGWGPVTITVNRRAPAMYLVTADQDPCGAFTRAPPPPISRSTPFWSMDATATDEATGRTDCAPANEDFTLRVDGRGWEPGYAYVEFRRDGKEVAGASRVPIHQADNTFSVRIGVKAQPAGATYSIFIYDLNERVITLPWVIPCPVGPTTSTSTTSTTTTTFTTPVGATLVVDPPLGPPGFVTQVRGSGYPPGPVLVRWEGGIGQVTVTAADDGTFSTPLLVLPNDRLGGRAVVATAGAVEQVAAFLVVPGTVEPSGRDVTQITRIRRHLQR